MKHMLILSCLLFAGSLSAQEILPIEIQIKTALLAAPDDQRTDATVLGYNSAGKLITLKQGSGNLVCLADDPRKKGIEVDCYAARLEPFMARGRELLAEGKTEEQKQSIRKQEIESGKIKMPEGQSMLYVLKGTDENYNKATGELKDGHLRYVIYVPYATIASTGLPANPSQPGMPWLMDPGTYKAHIMITPPKNK
ncbi:MAG: hypothetical protein IT250_10795 [Chitinophagaceae bacterium]|nr:hypothetical protein [Chitinophagaceae bacterium]